jgi:hypothetical protein
VPAQLSFTASGDSPLLFSQVKQHGGPIEVETELGAFTEFIITLPRGDGSAPGAKPE